MSMERNIITLKMQRNAKNTYVNGMWQLGLINNEHFSAVSRIQIQALKPSLSKIEKNMRAAKRGEKAHLTNISFSLQNRQHQRYFWSVYGNFYFHSFSFVPLTQAFTTYGPRAKCGPRKLLILPAKSKILCFKLYFLINAPFEWVKTYHFGPWVWPKFFFGPPWDLSWAPLL